MTLVIAHADGDIGFMIADTLLSSSTPLRGEQRPVSGASHTLKIHILSGRMAIAFAGDPGLACSLVAEVKADIDTAPDLDISQRLYQLYQQRADAIRGARSADFLVLSLTTNGKTLNKVTLENGVERIVRGYIGDPNGYRELMGLVGPYAGPAHQNVQQLDGSFRSESVEPTDGEQWFLRASDALESLCHKRSVETVGAISDAITRVVDARISGELEYMQAAYAGRSPEEGYTGYTLLAANTGTRAMAIYFYAGKLGFIFVPGDPAGCRRLSANSDARFIQAVRAQYGINLTGATMPV